MFDTENPAFQQGFLKEAWLDSRAQKIKFRFQQLLALKLKDAPAYVAEKVMGIFRKIGRAVWQIQYEIRVRLNDGHLENPAQILNLAVNSYHPASYIGRVVFFKATERPPGHAWDYSLSWSHLLTGEFEVHEVPGDHRSIFHEPNVEVL